MADLKQTVNELPCPDTVNLETGRKRTARGRVIENNERFILIKTRNYCDTILKASLIDGESTVGRLL
jgi:hypothetical protein